MVQLEAPFGALVAWIAFRDRLGWRRAFGMLVAFLGVALIAGEPRYEDNLGSILLVVSGALAFAVGQAMIKKLGVVGGFTLVAWVAVFAVPQLFVSSWIFEDGQWEAIANAPPVVWGAVIYLGVDHDGHRLRRLVSATGPPRHEPGHALSAAPAGRHGGGRNSLPG